MNQRLKDRLSSLSQEERQRLLKKLSADNPEPQPLTPVCPGREHWTKPSHQQRHFWTLNEVISDKKSLNSRFVVRIEGRLNVQAFETAIKRLAERHDIYRTVYSLKNGELRTSIRDDLIPSFDCQELGESEAHPEPLFDLFSEVIRPLFHLETDSPVRAKVFSCSAETHYIVFCFHHIACDGDGWNLLWNELRLLYQQQLQGVEPSQVAPEFQYSAYVQRQTGVSKINWDYWTETLKGLPDPPKPQKEFIEERFLKHEACEVTHDLEPALWAAAKQCAREAGTTLHNYLFSLFFIWHHKYFHSTDLVIGTPINLRLLSDDPDVHGCTTNMLPIRVKMEGTDNFREITTKVSSRMQEGFEHGEMPILDLMERFRSENKRSAPIYNAIFQLRNVLHSWEPLHGSNRVERVHMLRTSAQLPLLFEIEPSTESAMLSLTYDKYSLHRETALRILQQYCTLLKGVIHAPDRSLASMSLISGEEYEQLIRFSSLNKTSYPRDSNVVAQFAVMAETYPDQVAVRTDTLCYSYRELSELSDKIAAGLQQKPVSKGARIGIFMYRSMELIASMIAILKTGAVYVSLDTEYPNQRLHELIDDAQLAGILTQNANPTRLLWDCSVECWRVEALLTEAKECDLISVRIDATDPAYIMYTSGTTGMPKGTLISHRGIVRLVKNTDYADFSTQDCFLQLSPTSFDASTFEIWGSLLNGATLVLMPAGASSIAEIGDHILQFGITKLWLTAGLFHAVVDENLEILAPLNHLIAGGDTLSPKHVCCFKKAFPSIRLTNGYGPTENTTFSCCYEIPEHQRDDTSVPIGKAIANSQTYILDSHLNYTPIGVPGELYLGGDGLTLGYWNRPDLNELLFIDNPFSEGGSRLYRSGDRARYLNDGNIEFLGREDRQIKIRGYRIELGEIESVLDGHAQVAHSCVFHLENSAGEKHLAAVVVPKQCGKEIELQIQEYTRNHLPGFMVPNQWVFRDSLPLTPNGKVDRELLKTDALKFKGVGGCHAPENEQEKLILDIWISLFENPSIGCEDNFFDLGGHSLVAMRFVAEYEKRSGIQIRLNQLFHHLTVRSLARSLLKPTENHSTLVPMKKGRQEGPILHIIHGWGGGVSNHMKFVKLMDERIQVFGVHAVEHGNMQEPFASFEAMSNKYAADICANQETGPYYLAGYSLGGLIAFETARQLQKMGKEVGQLFMLDGLTRHLPWYVYYPSMFPYFRYRLRYRFSRLFSEEGGRIAYFVASCLSFLRKTKVLKRLNRYELDPVTGQVDVSKTGDYYVSLWDLYIPRPSTIPTTLYWSTKTYTDLSRIWGYLSVSNLTTLRVESAHHDMLSDAQIPTLISQRMIHLHKVVAGGDRG